MSENDTQYGNFKYQRDGDFSIKWQDTAPFSVEGRPGVTDFITNVRFFMKTLREDGKYMTVAPIELKLFENIFKARNLEDGTYWNLSYALGTLYSMWTYTDTLSARSMISANVKSPFVQKNQLSNVNVFSGKYEDGSTFEISCLGTM